MKKRFVVKKGRFCIGNYAYDTDEVFWLSASFIKRQNIQEMIDNGVIVLIREIGSSSEKKVEEVVVENKPEEIQVEDRTEEYPSEELESNKEKFTSSELYRKSKSEQVEILKQLGETEIPRYERQRVDKILELYNNEVNK